MPDQTFEVTVRDNMNNVSMAEIIQAIEDALADKGLFATVVPK